MRQCWRRRRNRALLSMTTIECAYLRSIPCIFSDAPPSRDIPVCAGYRRHMAIGNCAWWIYDMAGISDAQLRYWGNGWHPVLLNPHMKESHPLQPPRSGNPYDSLELECTNRQTCRIKSIITSHCIRSPSTSLRPSIMFTWARSIRSSAFRT